MSAGNPPSNAVVGIIMGSRSDWPTMREAATSSPISAFRMKARWFPPTGRPIGW